MTSTKAGLVFHDPSYGTSKEYKNQLLFNLITNITEPWTRPNLAKVVIAALGACPDLIRPYFIKVLQPLWSPRRSKAWLMVVDFLYAIMETLDVSKIVGDFDKNDEKSWKQFTTVISNFCCNEKLFKEVILECMKVEDHLVKVKGLELQALILGKLEQVMLNDKVSAYSKRQVQISFSQIGKECFHKLIE